MLLATDGVSHRYGDKTALDNVTIALEAGVIGILGRNGAGKSTLLNIVAGLLAPTRGAVTLDGQACEGRARRTLREAVGYLPQDLAFPVDVSADTYVGYLLGLRGITRRAGSRWLGELGLAAEAKRPLRTFSGGMLQRVGLAYALACDARLLLLDEPSQGLDPAERLRLQSLIADIADDRPVVFSTHIVGDIEAIATRMVILNEGRIVYDGSPSGFVDDGVAEPTWVLDTDRTAQALDGHTVTRVRRSRSGGVQVRGVGSPVPDGAVTVTPTVEDRYLRSIDA